MIDYLEKRISLNGKDYGVKFTCWFIVQGLGIFTTIEDVKAATAEKGIEDFDIRPLPVAVSDCGMYEPLF